MESRSGCGRLSFSSPAEDRISALPDDLLLLILARLRCFATAVRTSVLSRSWSGGLWTRLPEIVFRNVPFPSLEAALGRVYSPAVSLLEIRVPNVHRPGTRTHVVGGLSFNSLLIAAARLAPEGFVFRFPLDLTDRSLVVDLPCFPRTTSIVLVNFFLILRVPARVDFPALQTLSLTGRVPEDLDRLLSCCPRLRTLRLCSVVHERDMGYLRVSSALLQELFVDRSSKRTSDVSIFAPVLKQLTLSFIASDVSISVLAPMVEKVYWHSWYCTYDRPSARFGLWQLEHVTLRMAERQRQLPSLEICASASSHFLLGEENTFAQEIEKHMIAGFSVLDLHLTTNGHAFGALVFHLLGMARICGSIRRLTVILEKSTVKEECPFDCPCQPSNWRSQTVSLSSHEEVEINGFKGEDHEFDLLKLVFKYAPLLKKMTVKLSQEASTSNDGCARIYNIFEEYSSVECNVDHNHG